MSATRSDGAAPRAGALATSLSWITFALLALATAGALLLAQHLKNEAPLVGSNVVWHPVGPFNPRNGDAKFSFTTPYSDRITVSIVSESSGAVVAVLARGLPEHPGRQSFHWDGRTASGALAPAGHYEVAVHFERLERTPLVPSLRFDLKAPA